MALAQALINLESEAGRFFKIPSLDDDVVKGLLESVEASGGLPVTIDYREKILAVSRTDLTEVILPLCSWLEGLVKIHAEKEGDGRLLIGIVGPAGAGKSTLSQILCATCTILSGGAPWVQCVSMDGYSFPNSRLVAEQAVDNLGRICTLKDIKGLPSTLDVNVLLQDLLRLRTAGNDPILLPAYDRGLHEPVPNSVAIATDCKMVIFEGLHLLHTNGLWKDVSQVFYRTVFLDIERSCCFERVVGRKVANGRSRESSEAHFDRVDGPTFEQLQHERARANLTLVVRPTPECPLHVVNVEVRSSNETQHVGLMK